jgi:predicted dehydrogenase
MTELGLAIIGAGQRGSLYARLAARRGAHIVAVADPGRDQRERLAAEFSIPEQSRHSDWTGLLDSHPDAAAVIIATPDASHAAPALQALQQGYHLLLEKPLATDDASARQLVALAQSSGKVTALCHVLRYTPYDRELRRLLAEGTIGEPVSIQHLQPIGWWHFAHSFVRGNWHSESDGSSLLTAMAVHDVDWLLGLVDSPVRRVASFASLNHFRPLNRPARAADRCLDCAVETDCPYSAVRIYSGFIGHRLYDDWPLRVVAPSGTAAELRQALRDGPYGECVYLGRNDVADHQIVAMELANGLTIDLTLTAFTGMAGRTTRIFGSRGWIEGDGSHIRWQDFVSGESHELNITAGATDGGGVYATGDEGLISAFLAAVEANDPAAVRSSVAESYRTLSVVWQAERWRRAGPLAGSGAEHNHTE